MNSVPLLPFVNLGIVAIHHLSLYQHQIPAKITDLCKRRTVVPIHKRADGLEDVILMPRADLLETIPLSGEHHERADTAALLPAALVRLFLPLQDFDIDACNPRQSIKILHLILLITSS